MPFDQAFTRTFPGNLNTDVDPTTLSLLDQAAYVSRDNVFTFALADGGPQPQQLALAWVYQGSGQRMSPATCALFLWDANESQTWLTLPISPVSLVYGGVVYVNFPLMISRLSRTTQIAFVPNVAGPDAGTYTLEAALAL